MPARQDLVGQVFHSWTVLARVRVRKGATHYLCRCVCGTERAVMAGHLKNGASRCCGCIKKEFKRYSGKGIPITHGASMGGPAKWSRKYKAWRGIRLRTVNPSRIKSKSYKYYEHVTLYPAWLDYTIFDQDVPDPPDDTSTIDRIENSKGYEPGNVRWVSLAEQHRNQSNCRWIEFRGDKMLLTDWAKRLGITVGGLARRIAKWPLDRALTEAKKC